MSKAGEYTLTQHEERLLEADKHLEIAKTLLTFAILVPLQVLTLYHGLQAKKKSGDGRADLVIRRALVYVTVFVLIVAVVLLDRFVPGLIPR